jgi:hypothetical protein
MLRRCGVPVLASILMVSAAACSAGPGTAETASASASPSIAADQYLPIAEGNAWTYLVKGDAAGTMIRTMKNVTFGAGGAEGDLTDSTSIDDHPEAATIEQQRVRLRQDGGMDVMPYPSVSGSAVVSVSGTITYPSTAQYTAGRHTSGHLVLSIRSTDGTTSVDATFDVSSPRVQDVSTPAGRFHARVFVEVLTGQVADRHGTIMTTTSWFAPGVGMVKRTITSADRTAEYLLTSSRLSS